MRTVTEIIVHCTATPEGRECSVPEVADWHRQRGFETIGYHYLVHLDGRISQGRPLSEKGAHCLGHNARSIGIAYVGGCAKDCKTPKDTRTTDQKIALRLLIDNIQHGRLPIPVSNGSYICDSYTTPVRVGIYYNLNQLTIKGHNDYDKSKSCPSFNIAYL